MRYLSFRQAILAATLSLSLPSVAWANELNAQALDLAGPDAFVAAKLGAKDGL